MSTQWSKYQQAVFNWHDLAFSDGRGKAVSVRSGAGSGKTTTLVEAGKAHIPATLQDALSLAFNSDIAKVLKAKYEGTNIDARTYNSFGFQTLIRCSNGQKVVLDQDKTKKIFENLYDRYTYGYNFPAVRQLVSLIKANLVDWNDNSAVLDLAMEYGIELNGDAQFILSATAKVMQEGTNNTKWIDFDDQIYLPILYDMPIKKYDYIQCDECLPYKTPVLLGDGTSLEIGHIVDNKLPVTVLAYDVWNDAQKVCKVVGWHKILNQKPLVKVRVVWNTKQQKKNKTYNFVTCTSDHLIYTTHGYVPAGELEPGMVVQVETSAQKSDNYKITERGRKVLAFHMKDKNELGITGTHKTPKGYNVLNEHKGGNGRGLTEPQKLLLDALGSSWYAEYVVKTSTVGGMKASFPSVYKIDLANPNIMLAIEIDGAGHTLGKDKKKDDCLKSLGWRIIRLTNGYVMHHFDDLVEYLSSLDVEDCPIDATVVSIEKSNIKDWYVYDIDVEDCHNFYANGILVHNCQDTNAMQKEMIFRACKDNTVLAIVGDPRQAIYSWRGAGIFSMQELEQKFNADVLTLPVTYRNSIAVVELVRQTFPDIPIEYPDWAEQGEVTYLPFNKFATEVHDNDMILCRNNAPLVRPCYALIRQGKKAIIKGRDIGSGLNTLINKMKANNLQDLYTRLGDYERLEVSKLLASDKNIQAQAVEDKVETILALGDGCTTLDDLKNRIATVFSDDAAPITFSTVHKAKGLEAERVFILQPELLLGKRAKREKEIVSEKNVRYVAITRARRQLTFVENY